VGREGGYRPPPPSNHHLINSGIRFKRKFRILFHNETPPMIVIKYANNVYNVPIVVQLRDGSTGGFDSLRHLLVRLHSFYQILHILSTTTDKL
jgi:hypothetical protein